MDIAARRSEYEAVQAFLPYGYREYVAGAAPGTTEDSRATGLTRLTDYARFRSLFIDNNTTGEVFPMMLPMIQVYSALLSINHENTIPQGTHLRTEQDPAFGVGPRMGELRFASELNVNAPPLHEYGMLTWQDGPLTNQEFGYVYLQRNDSGADRNLASHAFQYREAEKIMDGRALVFDIHDMPTEYQTMLLAATQFRWGASDQDRIMGLLNSIMVTRMFADGTTEPILVPEMFAIAQLHLTQEYIIVFTSTYLFERYCLEGYAPRNSVGGIENYDFVRPAARPFERNDWARTAIGGGYNTVLATGVQRVERHHVRELYPGGPDEFPFHRLGLMIQSFADHTSREHSLKLGMCHFRDTFGLYGLDHGTRRLDGTAFEDDCVQALRSAEMAEYMVDGENPKHYERGGAFDFNTVGGRLLFAIRSVFGSWNPNDPFITQARVNEDFIRQVTFDVNNNQYVYGDQSWSRPELAFVNRRDRVVNMHSAEVLPDVPLMTTHECFYHVFAQSGSPVALTTLEGTIPEKYSSLDVDYLSYDKMTPDRYAAGVVYTVTGRDFGSILWQVTTGSKAWQELPANHELIGKLLPKQTAKLSTAMFEDFIGDSYQPPAQITGRIAYGEKFGFKLTKVSVDCLQSDVLKCGLSYLGRTWRKPLSMVDIVHAILCIGRSSCNRFVMTTMYQLYQGECSAMLFGLGIHTVFTPSNGGYKREPGSAIKSRDYYFDCERTPYMDENNKPTQTEIFRFGNVFPQATQVLSIYRVLKAQHDPAEDVFPSGPGMRSGSFIYSELVRTRGIGSLEALPGTNAARTEFGSTALMRHWLDCDVDIDPVIRRLSIRVASDITTLYNVYGESYGFMIGSHDMEETRLVGINSRGRPGLLTEIKPARDEPVYYYDYFLSFKKTFDVNDDFAILTNDAILPAWFNQQRYGKKMIGGAVAAPEKPKPQKAKPDPELGSSTE
jgi:hypothetical protein